MTAKEVKYVQTVVENEGFDYTFVGYTDFRDKVKDPVFHNLRNNFLKIRQDLKDYIGLEG